MTAGKADQNTGITFFTTGHRKKLQKMFTKAAETKNANCAIKHNPSTVCSLTSLFTATRIKCISNSKAIYVCTHKVSINYSTHNIMQNITCLIQPHIIFTCIPKLCIRIHNVFCS